MDSQNRWVNEAPTRIETEWEKYEGKCTARKKFLTCKDNDSALNECIDIYK